MSYVNKDDLVREIVETTGLTRSQVKQVTDLFLSNTLAHALEGKQVRLAGFGVFKAKYRAPRKNAFTPDTLTRGQTRLTFTPYGSAIEHE